jgi:hypothetical protein
MRSREDGGFPGGEAVIFGWTVAVAGAAAEV